MAGNNAEPPYFQQARAKEQVVVAETPKLDLETYIANYRGKTRIERLYHIGITSTVLSHEALQLAATEAKQGKDVLLYEKVMEALSQVEPNTTEARLDTAWTERTTREVKAETNRLELELKGYKNNLIKESIRMGYDDTGRHFQQIGELGEAAKAFTKEREYCQHPTHVSIMLRRLIQVSVEQHNWMNVESNVGKYRSVTQGTPQAGRSDAMMSAAIGLAQMVTNNYLLATRSFLECDNSLLQNKLETVSDDAESFDNLMTPSDIATYGALCALASLDRTQLQAEVLNNAKFRGYLEIEPHLRRAITSFVSGRFSTCLEILESYRPDYLLDIHLSAHFAALFDSIRNKALVQYFVPYSCVTFSGLAEAFNTNENTIETSLLSLIKQRSLPGRLDMEKRLLVANQTDSRSAVHEEALVTAQAYERMAHQKILRMELIHAGLEIKAPKKFQNGPASILGPGRGIGFGSNSYSGAQL